MKWFMISIDITTTFVCGRSYFGVGGSCRLLRVLCKLPVLPTADGGVRWYPGGGRMEGERRRWYLAQACGKDGVKDIFKVGCVWHCSFSFIDFFVVSSILIFCSAVPRAQGDDDTVKLLHCLELVIPCFPAVFRNVSLKHFGFLLALVYHILLTYRASGLEH